MFGLLGGLGWMALWNIGDPQIVDVVLMGAAVLGIPALVMAPPEGMRGEPSRSALSATARPVAWAAAGVALGAGGAAIDVDRVWSDISAVGGLAAAAGGAWLVMLDRRASPGTPGRREHPTSSSPSAALGATLGVTAGVTCGALARLGPVLAEEWQAGARYHLITFVVAGAGTGALVTALRWHSEGSEGSADPPAALPASSTAVLALAGSGSMLIAAASYTLVGIVVGCGLAAAFAVGCVVADASLRTLSTAWIGAAAGWAIVVGAWPTLLDGIGSPRTALALCAAPLGIIGAVALRDQVGRTSGPSDAPGAGEDPDRFAPVFAAGPLLEVEHLEFSYGDVQVLFGIDLTVSDGEIAALVGANGAGKTTLLDNIAGIATPQAGTVRLGGVDITGFSADERVRCGLNHIGAGTAVAEDLTVAENIALYGHSLSRRDAVAAAARAYEVFPALAERRTQRASSLSGGERQMLALAKSLVLAPRLLVIDEFSLGLAPIIVNALVPVIRRLHAEGAAVLLVEQSVHVALELANRATCMERGRIVYSGSAAELRADPGLLEAVYLEGVSAALEHRAEATAAPHAGIDQP